MTLLSVRNLVTSFTTGRGVVRAVDGISFDVNPGETLGLVGESGCGKSVTALSILRLIPEPPGTIAPESAIELEGEDVLTMPPKSLRRVRGGRIGMIFQEPGTSLNPVLSVGYQITEAILAHEPLSHADARHRAMELLHSVGIPEPARRYRSYPHEMSGGMQQRVMIAIALSCRPQLLIADEPTTALDVTIQAQILDLLIELRERLHMAVLFITHDLSVVAQVADRVAVMYGGRIVETGTTRELFEHPRHPYTIGLLDAVPRLDRSTRRLKGIPGTVPQAGNWPPGCRFHPRCDRRVDRCDTDIPVLRGVSPGHQAACWLLEDGSET